MTALLTRGRYRGPERRANPSSWLSLVAFLPTPVGASGLALAICLALSLDVVLAHDLDLVDPQLIEPHPAETDSIDARSTPRIPFWPEVVDTVQIVTPAPDARQRIADGTGSASYIPLGLQVAGDENVASLIDRVVGLHVHRFGGIGSYSLASVRGSTPGQVQVYLDDMPLSNATSGVVNLSLLPLAELDHAEVYRGPQTLPLGGPPAAGVIRLVSPERLGIPLGLAIGGGSFGTRSFRGQWGHQHGPWGAYLGGQWRQSDGDYPYLNRNGTRHNLEDDRIVRRANNRFEDLSTLARVRLTPSDPIRLDYTVTTLSRESGIPGPESVPTTSTDYSLDQQRHQFGATLGGAYPFGDRASGRAKLSAFVFRERTVDHFRNLLGEVGLGHADQRSVTRNTGTRIRGTFPWVTLGQQFDVGLFANRERRSPHDLLRDLSPDPQVRVQRSWSLAHRAEWRSWSLSVGYTRDWMRDRVDVKGSPETTHDFDQTTFGIRWNVTDRFALRGNHGRFYRVPTFPELFGQNGLQDGNPELVPETGPQWDAGIIISSQAPPSAKGTSMRRLGEDLSWRVEGTYFESLMTNKIVLIQNSQRTVQAHNFDRAWIHGVEVSSALEWNGPDEVSVRTEFNFTRQHTRNLSKSPTYRDKSLPTLPELEGYFRTILSWSQWSGEYAVTGRGKAFRDRYNSANLEAAGYAVHELVLERSILPGHLRLRGAVRNLADRRVQDIDGYPLPGRSYLIELIGGIN